MSDHIKTLYYVLWSCHPILQLAIVLVMLRRKQYRHFKFFFLYVLAQIISFALIFPFRSNFAAWFYLSWGSTVISVALGFKVIHEAFLDVFRPFHTLRDMGTVLFQWAGLVMLLVAVVVSLSTNSSENLPWVQAILTTQRCVRIIQVGMVLFLLFFSRYLGVSRRQQSFGIALGFGLFAFIELSLVASWVGYHMASKSSTDLINMGAYNLTLMVWLGYCLAKSPARDAPATLFRSQRWEQSLTDLQHPVPADSLIPMFEDMVDRALSRTQAASPLFYENSPTLRAAAAAGAHGSPSASSPVEVSRPSSGADPSK
jgi:hypothetical protein